MLYATALELIYFITGSFYTLSPFTIFTIPSPTPLATTNLFSVSMTCLCCSVLDSTYKEEHKLIIYQTYFT